MKSIIKVVFLLAVATAIPTSLIMASGSHKHDEHKKKEETKKNDKIFYVKGTQLLCPIRKEKIDKESYVDFQGQRVYFCCQGCDKKFLKDANTHFTAMKARGEVTESIQTHCAVSGDKLDNHKHSITLAGRKIYFCCKDCIKDFKKDKDTYLKKMSVKKTDATKSKEKKDHDHSSHKH